MNLFWKKAFFFLSAALLLAACGPAPRQRTVAVMDDVETYINERPDSALAVLKAVDTTSLTTRALRARYSLLRMMALDKCYLDITAPGLLDPAIAWYEHHGTADEKMKTLYYQGRIAQDKKDQKNAAVFYARAEDYAEAARDMHAVGLLYGAIASVYDAVYNIDKEQEYVEKSLAVYKNAQDPIYGSALGGLAIVYQTRQDWSKADSLYQEAIAQSDAYPHAKAIFLSNYARMKVLQPNKDPEVTINLLDQKRRMTGSLTYQEAGAYAYASELLGNQATSNALVAQLQSTAEEHLIDVLPWMSRIATLRNDYESAYHYWTEAHLLESKLVKSVLTESVTEAVFGYREMAARQKQLQYRINIAVLAIILLLLALALALAMLRKNKLETEKSRILELYSNLEKEAATQESRSAAMSDDFSSRLEALRLQLGRERLDRLRRGGRYSYWMWMEQNGRSSDAHIINGLRKEFQEVCALEKDTRALERRLNADLDGIVSHLKADLGIREHTEDEKFLCYWLIDLKPDMIAELLGISNNYVYVKTHRLEKRIRDLGKAEYMPLIQKNLTKSI